jgi:hypothetical protein
MNRRISPVWGTLGLALLCLQLVVAVHIVYDETVWTKQNWADYKIDPGVWGYLNPSDEVIKSPELLSELQKTSWNSLDGPMPRRTASAPLYVERRFARAPAALLLRRRFPVQASAAFAPCK